MPKFTKAPVTVDAVQWTGTKKSLEEIERISKCNESEVSARKQNLSLKFEESEVTAKLNDWVVAEEDGIIVLDQEDFDKIYSIK